jgi:hypothetical protein
MDDVVVLKESVIFFKSHSIQLTIGSLEIQFQPTTGPFTIKAILTVLGLSGKVIARVDLTSGIMIAAHLSKLSVLNIITLQSFTSDMDGPFFYLNTTLTSFSPLKELTISDNERNRLQSTSFCLSRKLVFLGITFAVFGKINGWGIAFEATREDGVSFAGVSFKEAQTIAMDNVTLSLTDEWVIKLDLHVDLDFVGLGLERVDLDGIDVDRKVTYKLLLGDGDWLHDGMELKLQVRRIRFLHDAWPGVSDMAQVTADIHTVNVHIQETLDIPLSVSSMEELGHIIQHFFTEKVKRTLAEIADPFAKGFEATKEVRYLAYVCTSSVLV